MFWEQYQSPPFLGEGHLHKKKHKLLATAVPFGAKHCIALLACYAASRTQTKKLIYGRSQRQHLCVIFLKYKSEN